MVRETHPIWLFYEQMIKEARKTRRLMIKKRLNLRTNIAANIRRRIAPMVIKTEAIGLVLFLLLLVGILSVMFS